MSTGWPRGRARDGGIDRIPLPANERGALWLCGKHAIGPDAVSVIDAVGATTVVCLTERHELADRYPAYVDWLDENSGRRAVWFPIPDLHAPDIDEVMHVLADLCARLDSGERIVVHCAAGIGRAGTMAACLLVTMGVPTEDALAHIAAHRPMAGPEVGAQRGLVDAVAERAR